MITDMELASGYTLMHEHMSIALSPGDLGTDSFEGLCTDLCELRAWGVGNIVDLTNQTMGRDVDYVRRLSEETGINIIMATGYYLEPYLTRSFARFIEEHSVAELADLAVRELTAGIGGTEERAGVIGEIAWSDPGPGPLEAKAWDAMCEAALRTGAVVSTHTSRGYQCFQQAKDLVDRGIDPRKIVIGHCEFCSAYESPEKLLATGVCMGTDTIGKTRGRGDEHRADLVRTIKDTGCLSQVVLSLDLYRREDLRSASGYGYAHVFETFVPMLQQRGISDDDIELMPDAPLCSQ